MSHTKEKNLSDIQALTIRKSEKMGLTTLELDPNWEAGKRRVEAFTELVLARFNPCFSTAKSCIAIFGRGTERNNEEALRCWLVVNYQDHLNDRSANITSLAEVAYKRVVLKIHDEGGFWEVMA